MALLNCHYASFLFIFASQILNTFSISTKEPHSFYTIFYPHDYKNLSTTSHTITNSSDGLSDISVKHYIPFDPEVQEGEMPPARKELTFERVSKPSSSPIFNHTWKYTQQETISFSTDKMKQKENTKVTESVNNSNANFSESDTDNKETLSSEDFVHPEEIIYNNLGKEESESTEEVLTSTETSGDGITERTSTSGSTSDELATEMFEMSSEQNTSQEITFRTESSVVVNVVKSLANNISSAAKNLKITLPTFKLSSIFDREMKDDSDSRKPKLLNYTLHNEKPLNNVSSNSQFPPATEITKINVKFTVSAEDTRWRTKESPEEEINEVNVTNFDKSSVQDSTEKMTLIKIINETATTLRQPKAIEKFFVTQDNSFNFHKKNSNSSQIFTSSIIPSIQTTPISSILMTNDSFHSTIKNEDLTDVSTSITTPSYISETLSIFKAFSEMKNDTHFQETISILTKNINPLSESSSSKLHETTTISQSTSSLMEKATSPPIERATIRRRLLRPLLKNTTNPLRNHRRTHTQSAIQEFRSTSTVSHTSPPKTLNETVAPPVSKLDDFSIDYPMDMPDTRTLFEDSSSNISISPKTQNTIIISSIIGGCAIIFFAFLMVFCMCKQKRNNRRGRY